MNALQISKIENHVGGLVLEVQEWASVLFVKYVKRTFDAWGETSRKTVCRFVSKKVINPAQKKEASGASFKSIVKQLMMVDCTIGVYAEESEIEAAERQDYSQMHPKLAREFKDVHQLVALIGQKGSEQKVSELGHGVSNGKIKF